MSQWSFTSSITHYHLNISFQSLTGSMFIVLPPRLAPHWLRVELLAVRLLAVKGGDF